MFRFVQRHSLRLLALLAVMAIVLSGCTGSSNTAAPTGSGGAGLSPAATDDSGNTSGGPSLSGAAGAFANLDSYKFSMTLAGDAVVSGLPDLPGTSISGSAPVNITGTETVKPDKGADVNVAGFHMIEIGGFDYFDTGGGGFLKAQTSTSLANSFSPVQRFSSAIAPSTASGYTKIGTETKNGVQADHYQASSAALAELGSVAGVTGTWTADVWIATVGGYPVSAAVIAKASDNSVVYQVSFEITNVNDPANQVTAPTNVTGV